MAGRGRMTKYSTLEHLAKVFETRQSIVGLGIMSEGELLEKLSDLAPKQIRRELDHIDWLYETGIREGMHDLAVVACHDAGRVSGIDDGQPSVTDDDLISWLCEPQSPAQTLAGLARLYKVDLPEIVKRALTQMEERASDAA